RLCITQIAVPVCRSRQCSRTWPLCGLGKGHDSCRWEQAMISKAAFFALPIFMLVLLTLPSQASDANQAGFDLPQPNGCHPVGTRTLVLRDPRRSRDLLVTMWYPAVDGTSALAPYMYVGRKCGRSEERRVGKE